MKSAQSLKHIALQSVIDCETKKNRPLKALAAYLSPGTHFQESIFDLLLLDLTFIPKVTFDVRKSYFCRSCMCLVSGKIEDSDTHCCAEMRYDPDSDRRVRFEDGCPDCCVENSSECGCSDLEDF